MKGFNLTIILVALLILFSSMDFKNKIIQWNCPGLKPNYNEVSLLISEYNPSVFCFQEHFLNQMITSHYEGPKGIFFFSKSGHVAYQIKVEEV